jgi:hypothetical protein
MQHASNYEHHFERVLPIVGPALGQRSVAVLGLSEAAAIVEHLAASGIRRWLWEAGPQAERLAQRIAARHGNALELELRTIDPARWPGPPERSTVPDLVVAIGRPLRLLRAYQAARRLNRPALLAARGAAGWRALHVLCGDDRRAVLGWISRACMSPIIAGRPALQDWEMVTVSPFLAGLCRALLLRATPYARPDLERLWTAGLRQVAIGGRDPLAIAWGAEESAGSPDAATPFVAPAVRRARVLVVGLGSLGSVAATLLAPAVEQLVLVDPDVVDLANPARQAYRYDTIGQPKATALAAALAGQGAVLHGLPLALTSEPALEALVRRYQVTAALVATGTAADFALARALRALDIPHVVARCYPRAQYWEAILVDGRNGAAFGDIRGHLAPGPHAPPTPEQIAAYSDAGALEAEPATLVESGWAAAWAARLTAQLATPAGLRERWILELLAARQTCLVGGVGVQQTPHGPAYGVALPGQIHAWGPASIAGAGQPYELALV